MIDSISNDITAVSSVKRTEIVELTTIGLLRILKFYTFLLTRADRWVYTFDNLCDMYARAGTNKFNTTNGSYGVYTEDTKGYIQSSVESVPSGSITTNSRIMLNCDRTVQYLTE